MKNFNRSKQSGYQTFPNSGGGDGSRHRTAARTMRRKRWTGHVLKLRHAGAEIFFPTSMYPANS